MSDDPAIKTKQHPHQEEIYLRARDLLYFALLWEMGLGKAKEAIDVAAHLYLKQNIDCLLVVGPNAVYKNWLTQEMPAHCAVPYVGMAFPKSTSYEHDLKRELFLDKNEFKGKMRFICISYRSLWTDHGMEFLTRLMKQYRTMMVADESTALANPDTKQTKAAKKLRKLAHYAWIETGTPVANGPFQIHSQIEFLDPDFWGDYGMRTFGAFKSQFGVFELVQKGKKRFNERTGYRNLERLQKMIAPISSRLLKDDSTVKLPPKTYALRTFEMSDQQWRVYNELKTEFQAELDNGLFVEAAMGLVRSSRLQQITSGFVTAQKITSIEDADQLELEGIKIINSAKQIADIIPPKDNPRLQLLEELLDEAAHKVVVWCRYRHSVDIICEHLGDRCIRYDGSVPQKDREGILARFRDPTDPAQVLVANVHAISQGVTLVIAKTMIYYENDYSLEKRQQSEDRNHRIGQDKPVLIIDIAAEETIDLKVTAALKDKFNIAALVTGDRFREWIQ